MLPSGSSGASLSNKHDEKTVAGVGKSIASKRHDELTSGSGPRPRDTMEVAPVAPTMTVDAEPATGTDVPLHTDVPESWDSFSNSSAVKAEGTAMPVPERIGRYQIVRRLGIGGMAEVFLGEQAGPAGFAKKVVVKRMLPHLAMDKRVVELFLREARIAARLTHPNIVQIYELGEDEGRYFIAMEYVDGISVLQLAKRHWAARKALPLEAIKRIVADAALGLHGAHELRGDDGQLLGVVHRDISPDNLMVTREGVTKVLDFGIAKATRSENVTRTGELKGKIPFMAPEMLRGESIDRRVDLYALGVSLYWMLTGRRPFKGETDFITIDLVMRAEAAPPSALVPSVPPDIDELVVRLLSKQRDARVPTGAELHRILVRDLPVDATVVQDVVATALGLPDEAVDMPPSTIGTSPDVEERSAPRTGAPPAPSSSSPQLTLQRAQRRRLLMAAGAYGLAAAGVIALIAAIATSGEPAPSVGKATPVPKPGAVAAAVASPAEPAAPPTTPAPPVEPAVVVDAPPERPAPASAPAPTAAPAMRAISVKAPARIVWRSASGAELGRGNATLRVPASARSIIAYDTLRSGTTKVPLTASTSSLSYDALPKGTLEVRAFPFASVELGQETLGTTPVQPKELVAGSYKLKLTHESRVITKTVDVVAGKIERVNAKMNEP